MAVVHHHHHHTPPAIIMKIGDERPVPLTPALKKEYEKLYNTQKGNPKYAKLLDEGVAQINLNADRYRQVEARSGVPWYVVGVLHLLECGSRFNCHLHNGDPLAKKTVNVPKGRPNLNTWTWEDSAVDALNWEKDVSWGARGLDAKDWSLGAVLYRLEAWNGFGSRKFRVPTPFIWSGTKFYKAGKYSADGHWDKNLVSQQIGAAPVLKALNDKGFITFPEEVLPSHPLVVK